MPGFSLVVPHLLSLGCAQLSKPLGLEHLVYRRNVVFKWSLEVVPERRTLGPDAVMAVHGELGDRQVGADVKHKSEAFGADENIFQGLCRCFHPSFVGFCRQDQS